MSRRKIRFWRAFWWSLFAIWLVLTVYLSSQNGSGSSDVSSWLADKLWRASNVVTKALLDRGMSFATFHLLVRKLAHFTVHLFLAFFAVRASAWSFSQRREGLRFAWILSICLAVFDEAIQLLAPGRVSALLDGGINLAGVTLGALISSLLGPRQK
ncbi:VanZ family protein [Candidatus Saccharibacteria bacterium]|nr:VanZ family protein [Candidatus Saccharibacteria bacterium]